MDTVTERPRTFRTDSYYHVVLSGNRRKSLFSTADDRRALNAIAIDTLQRYEATLHAYCLMPNHFRALVQIDDRVLIKTLRRIATHYSGHRQRHLKSAPHLFERPYTAQRIDTDGDFLNLLRSIHLSPVLANKVVGPADYLWSSHRAYLGYKSVAKITTDFGLSLFAESPAQARVAYHQFIEKGIAEDFGRAVDRRSQMASSPSSIRPTAIAVTDAQCAPHSEPFCEPPHQPIESRIQLPTTNKSALPRFGRSRNNTLSRRFLSIY